MGEGDRMTTEALLILGHGSHLNPGSSEPVRDHADVLRQRETFDEVAVAFWKEEPSFREVLRTIDADRVYAVPFFMAEGYFVDQVIPREMRLPLGRVTYTEPVGTHTSMTDVIVDRAVSVYDGEGKPALAVVGHGTDRNPKSAESALEHVDRIREQGEFSEVEALFMDEPPYVDDVADYFVSDDVVVVPFFSSDGYHTQEDIPEDMGIAEPHADGYDVPAETDGKRVWYTGAVGTETGIADVVAERARDAREQKEAVA
jgi:sirohydrochlorin cobaltochelatase